MLALQTVFEQKHISRDTKNKVSGYGAPFAPTSYSGFVPNEVFNSCSPVETAIYACVQFLSFFDIPCSTWNIAKNLNASSGTIRNALNSLSKRLFIEKQPDGTYLFKNHKLDRSKELVGAKELAVLHLGYWFPIWLLKDKKINNSDKKTYALMKNFTKTKQKCMDMVYIAQKISRSRSSASRSINKLLEHGFLTRNRNSNNSAYFYQTGRLDMSIEKPEVIHRNGQEINDAHQNDTVNCHQNATPIYNSNKNNNIYINTSKLERESATYEISQKTSFLFLEELVNSFAEKISRLEKEKERKDRLSEELNKEYTKACVDCDFDEIQKLRPKISQADLSRKTTEDELEKTKGILTSYDYCLENNQSVRMNAAQYAKLGSSIKKMLPDFSDRSVRKKAFCVLMNSAIMDFNSIFYKTLKSHDWRETDREEKSIRESVDFCIGKLNRNDYKVNQEITLDLSSNSKYDGSTEPYRDRYHWVN